MIPVLTADDVRRQDAEAVSRGVSVAQLMENAGWAVSRAARRMMGGSYGRRIVVVCGKGNNAGDGLVAGRILHEQGAHVTAVLITPALNDLASQQRARFPGALTDLGSLDRELTRADLVIDAIFGVGLSRAPEGDFARAIELIASHRVKVLSVDVPSGLDSDTGTSPGCLVSATSTTTFTGWKPGLLFAQGRSCGGTVTVADIGIPLELRAGVASAIERADIDLPQRGRGAHKRNSGVALIVAGSRAMPGAAVLATSACVRAGAGLTTLVAPESVCALAVSKAPAITTIPIPETSEGTLDQKILDVLRARFSEFDVMAIGPGLSTHPATVETVRTLIAEAPMPVIADADALNAIAGASGILRDRSSATIVTPHAGELSRLTGIPSVELEGRRLRSAMAAANELGSIVLFKGAGTVTAGPGGETYVNTTGGPWLAQGGTGDVLTGLIAGLVAQRVSFGSGIAVRDVAIAAWLHGFASDLASQRRGAHGSVGASELIDYLGEVMSR